MYISPPLQECGCAAPHFYCEIAQQLLAVEIEAYMENCVATAKRKQYTEERLKLAKEAVNRHIGIV